jgi:ribose transport system ATP-binding protein
LEPQSAPPAVELRNISKIFGNNRALDQVDLTIGQGEVLGLLGQNGSGKSTLVKILSGVYDPEPGGSLRVDGNEVPLPLPPGQAIEIGLSFVYQNLALAPGLTVLENLTLGQRVATKRGFGPINWSGEHRAGRVSLERYQVYLDLDQKAGELAPVDQARLAIVRAAEDLRRYRELTGGQSSVLVLDEPTVFLPEEEIDRLFDLIRQVVADGAAVLFISHDLNAVQAITDRLVVLRDGRVVAEEVTANVNEDAMVDLIVGASASARAAAVDTANVTALVEDKLAVEATREAMTGGAAEQGERVSVEHLYDDRIHGLSFEIAPGEILGVAGLIGSGAEELPYLLFGARQAISGSLRLGDELMNVDKLTPVRAVRERMALVPADRTVQGLSQGLTLWENVVMLVEDEHFRGGIFRRGELLKLAEDAIDRFLIRPALAHAPVGTFSGGNQQKALMAKWLIARPRLLLLHEPTQGVDVGARRDIYRFVKAAATLNQMAVLWVTTEFGELAEVCDRVIVLNQGRHTETLAGDELSEEAISAAALRQQTREVS